VGSNPTLSAIAVPIGLRCIWLSYKLHDVLARVGPMLDPTQALAAAQRTKGTRFSPRLFWFFLLAALMINYPGRISRDALEQLIGAYDAQFLTDWHSPLVTWLWSLAGGWLGQPAGALLIQSVPLAFYAAVGPRRPVRWAGKDYLAAAFECAFKAGLIAFAGTVIKDVLLGAFLLASIAALQLSLSSGKPGRWLTAFLACLLVVALVRPANFVFLLVPGLAFILVYAATPRMRWVGALGVLAVSLLLLASYGPMSRFAFGAQPVQPERQLILFDLAGVSALTGKNLLHGIGGVPTGQLSDPRTCYSPAMWDPMAPWGECPEYSKAFDQSHDRAGLSPWLRAWGAAIILHPGAYLTHRSRHLHGVLTSGLGRFGERSAWGSKDALLALNSTDRAAELRALSGGRVPDGYFANAEQSVRLKPFSRMTWLMLGIRGMPLLALAVCVGLLAAQVRRRVRGLAADPVILLVTAFGVANVLVVAFFGVATSARYLLPLILCSYVAVLTLLQNRASQAAVSA
jgi:hypothetical protein